MHVDTEKLALYATGDSEGDIAEIAAHVASCAQCRALVERYQRIAAGIAVTLAPVPAGMADALWRRAHAPKRHTLWRTVAVASPLIAAGILAIVLTPGLMSRSDEEFHAKGAAEQSTDAFVGIEAYRVTSDSALAVPMGTTIHAGDGLTFAYRNRGQTPARYLMVVAVDQARRTFWFYPVHSDAGIDPASIAIEVGDGVKLPDIVTHDFAPGHLVIYGLFSSRPLRVSEVEGAIAATSDLALNNVAQQRIDVEVLP
jgi:hypothetical protein